MPAKILGRIASIWNQDFRAHVRQIAGLLVIADAAEPPLRLPFGSDAIKRIEAKNAHVAAEIAQWRDLAISTDAV